LHGKSDQWVTLFRYPPAVLHRSHLLSRADAAQPVTTQEIFQGAAQRANTIDAGLGPQTHHVNWPPRGASAHGRSPGRQSRSRRRCRSAFEMRSVSSCDDESGAHPHDVLAPLTSASTETSRTAPHRHRQAARRPLASVEMTFQ
jgi:hypothetical protein